MEKYIDIFLAFADSPELTATQLVEAVNGEHFRTLSLVDEMIHRGWIQEFSKNGKDVFHLAPAGRVEACILVDEEAC